MVLGLCGFRESREKSRTTGRAAGESWKPRGGKVFVFLLVSPGVLAGEGETYME